MLAKLEMLWTISKSVYDSNSFSEEIENIYTHIKSIYSDMSDVHVNSAKQAIKAAKTSDFSAHEILDAVAHLRDAYNISKIALNKKRKIRYWLFFKDEVDIIPFYERLTYFHAMACFAGLISILYGSIGQKINSNEWKSMSLNDYKEGLKYIYIDAYELSIIDPSFVEEYEVERTRCHGGVDCVAEETYWETEIRPSSSGKVYFEEQKNSMLRKHETKINEKSLKL